MLGAFVFHLGIAALLVALWYAALVAYHRRRAGRLLQTLKELCDGNARVIAVQWKNPWLFSVSLKILSGLFQRASIVVQLHPRPLPLSWLLSVLQKRREVLIFQADLEFPPAFNLQVHNQRWYARSRNLSRHSGGIQVEACTPLIITTRNDWQRDITNMMSALLASRSCDLISVRFRRESPHFSADLLLDSLSPAAAMFETLRELACCALASRF